MLYPPSWTRRVGYFMAPILRPISKRPSGVTLQEPVGSALAMSRPSETTRATGLNFRTIASALVEFFEISAVVDVFGQGEVAVEPLALALAHLVGEAREIGVGEVRVAVDRDGQDVGSFPEDILGPVAVVVIDVEDRHGSVELGPEILGGDRAVAEVAEAAVRVTLGVVAGRPAKAVDQRLAVDDRRGSRERDVHRRPRGPCRRLYSGV